MSTPLAVVVREHLIAAGAKLRPYTPAEVRRMAAREAAYERSAGRLVLPWEAPGRPHVWGLRRSEVVL